MSTKASGLIESALIKMFMCSVEVVDVEDLGPAYRIVTLGGEALRHFRWTPGDKVQIQLGGWVQRTYTPMDWDGRAGLTRILVYRHATGGPGAEWIRSVQVGDSGVLFGPRKSVRLLGPPSPVVFFGDETSLGLACALRDQMAPAAVKPSLDMVLELSSTADSALVLQRLGLAGARVCVRQPDDGHFKEMAHLFLEALQADANAEVVLSGHAGAIKHLSRCLKQPGRNGGRRQSKAYWATGKAGLD